MFTGLVESTGSLLQRQRASAGFRLVVRADVTSPQLGESIAVNGACLTVTQGDAGTLVFDVSSETVERTNLGRLPLGARVNLERALPLGARVGGHLVSGHVDGLAHVSRVTQLGEGWRLSLAAPPELLPYIAPKGSVALDGVSLTVNAVASGGFEVMLIPHTRAVTTLDQAKVGQQLNLEVDLIARYVIHYLRTTSVQSKSSFATTGLQDDSGLVQALKRAGIL